MKKTDQNPDAKPDRQQRQAEALRANLARRKAQVRDRAEAEGAPESGNADAAVPGDQP